MERAALFLLLTGIVASGQEFHWESDYDQSLEFKCPAGQSISHIKIQHGNPNEDLTWEFSCKDTFDTSVDCFLSPNVNELNQTFTYECPQHHIITGMSTYHSKNEDRRWQFYCCRSNSRCTANCEWTPDVNGIEFNLPNQKYLVGAESFHEKPEDWGWKYKHCSIEQC
uniref:Si:dkey-14d8.6 n=1 Tax=Cyprinus carpio TaxID=7962 RepID=A0A8C2CXV8_CYPCA